MTARIVHISEVLHSVSDKKIHHFILYHNFYS